MPLLSNSEPTGTVREFASTSEVPHGYLLCDGAVVSRSSYPSLFQVIGTTFNTGGETSAQFRLPDLRGKAIIGAGQDTTRSLSARTLGTYLGAETHTLTQSELASHAHSAGTMATETQAHKHSATSSNVDLNHTHSYLYNFATNCVDGPSNKSRYSGEYVRSFDYGPSSTMAHSHTSGMNPSSGNHTHTFTTNSGDSLGGGAHPNVQPYVALCCYIKY